MRTCLPRPSSVPHEVSQMLSLEWTLPCGLLKVDHDPISDLSLSGSVASSIAARWWTQSDSSTNARPEVITSSLPACLASCTTKDPVSCHIQAVTWCHTFVSASSLEPSSLSCTSFDHFALEWRRRLCGRLSTTAQGVSLDTVDMRQSGTPGFKIFAFAQRLMLS